MTTDTKQHSFTAIIFRVLKAFLLLLLLGQMQTASAQTVCSDPSTTAFGGYNRTCMNVSNSSPQIGDTVYITGWVEVACSKGSTILCVDPYGTVKFLTGALNTQQLPAYRNSQTARTTYTYVAGESNPSEVPNGIGASVQITAYGTFSGSTPQVTITNRARTTTTKVSTVSRSTVRLGEKVSLQIGTSAYKGVGTTTVNLVSSPFGALDKWYVHKWTDGHWNPDYNNWGLGIGLDFTPPVPGKYVISATFDSTTPNNSSSKSAEYIVEVLPAETINKLTAMVNGPIAPGGPVSLTSELSGFAGERYGIVKFYDGETLLGASYVISNRATIMTTAIKTAGIHAIRAEYSGDGYFAASTSNNVNIEVVLAKSTTTLSSSQNKSALGKPITFSAQVSGTNPTGSVSFFDGGNLIGTATAVGGVANLEIATIQTLGDHVITATYGGDEVNLASTSLPITQTILQGVTVNKLSAITQTPAASGSLVILTADLSGDGNGRTGSIEFFEGEALLGSSTVANNRAEISTNSLKTLGAHTLRAKYSGDANFAASTSDDLIVTIELAKSETVLTSAASPVMAGKPVTLNAQVTGLNPTGSVSFYDKTTLLGKANLQDGVASLTTSAIRSVGVREITAVYSGDELNRTSTSASLQQTMSFNPAYLMPILQILLN